MIDEIVELAQRKIDERRELIKNNELFEDYEKEYYLKSTDEEEDLIIEASENFKNEEMISTEHLDYVVYRQTLWTLFANNFTPEVLEQLGEDAENLCEEFGSEELGYIDSYFAESKSQGEAAVSERHHIAWLIRAYNCMIQGINVKALMTELEKARYVVTEDKPL